MSGPTSRRSRPASSSPWGIPAEQVTLLIQVDDDVTLVIRFIAPEGGWEHMMQDACDSVRATKD